MLKMFERNKSNRMKKKFEHFYAIGWGYKFSESYKEWIKIKFKEHFKDMKIIFKEQSFIIDWSKNNQNDLCEALIFIGFAFGEQNNGK